MTDVPGPFSLSVVCMTTDAMPSESKVSGMVHTEA